jgi:uncharacterized protein (UPF0128 family)
MRAKDDKTEVCPICGCNGREYKVGDKFHCNGHAYKVIGFDHEIPVLEQLEVVEFT